MTQAGTPIAGIEAASALAVLRPGPLAEPAELEAALAAGHVHAALVLLNWPLALGALLRVRQNPIQVLALRAVFQDPLVHSLAVHLAQKRQIKTGLTAHRKSPS